MQSSRPYDPNHAKARAASAPPPASSKRQAEVIKWRAHTKNTLRGFISLKLPSGLVIHDMTLHEKEGRRWVGLPSRSYQDNDGETQWIPVVECPDRSDRDRFNELALAALDAYLAGGARG